ncbi:MAG: hypothetical protein HYV65_01990 [Candidatus Spechtbacteria bacterium]|nr:hypothetical protein [Candidatus Spechtbacteria bacterium]
MIRDTWWFITPLLLWPLFWEIWLYWRFYLWASKIPTIMLEIKPPPDVLKTPKAMEVMLAGLHGSWGTLKTRDYWIWGKRQPRFNLEFTGENGRMHFYIRCQRKYRNFVEAHIYAEYPDAEIFEVEDYVNRVPPDLPNKEWELWGTEMKFDNNQAYPIRTYEYFEDMEEERRIDPLSTFAEVISKLGEGEHVWVQIIIQPILSSEWTPQAKEVLDKLLGRGTGPTSEKSFFEHIAEMTWKGIRIVTHGEVPVWDAAKAEENQFGALRLSRYEQDIVAAVANKMSKPGFNAMVRTLYIGRRDVYDGTVIGAVQGAFKQFTDQNLNGLRLISDTKPSNHIILFREMRNQRRRIRQFRLYKGRMFNDFFGSEPYVMNTEELATLFHFPGRVIHAPSFPRVESKRGEPPAGLPF